MSFQEFEELTLGEALDIIHTYINLNSHKVKNKPKNGLVTETVQEESFTYYASKGDDLNGEWD